MAKFKSAKPGASSPAKPAPAPARKTASTRTAAATRKKSAAAPADDHAARGIMDSAQQIWQTSVKALGRAQQESTRLFEALVKEGVHVEKKTRSLASGKVNAVRGSVENRVEQVKDRAADTWDRLEKVFEERVQRALVRLGVPGREELQALIQRVDQLNARLRDLAETPAARKQAPAASESHSVPPATRTAKPEAAKAATKPATAKKKPVAKAPTAAKPASGTARAKPAAKKAKVTKVAQPAALEPAPSQE